MSIRVIPTALDGVVIIEPQAFKDARGFFVESYHRQKFFDAGLRYEFVQDNHSRSARGVLRGLHYQTAPNPQDKLVRCTAGAILDVAVDIRAGSPTLGAWVSAELSADNLRQLMVPAGFAHGFVVLSEMAEVQYKVTYYYDQAAEGGLRWDDPQIGIDWRVDQPVLSKRDAEQPGFAEYLRNPRFTYSG